MYHQYKIVGDFSRFEEYVNKLPDGDFKNSIVETVESRFGGNYENVLPKQGIAAEALGKEMVELSNMSFL